MINVDDHLTEEGDDDFLFFYLLMLTPTKRDTEPIC